MTQRDNDKNNALHYAAMSASLDLVTFVADKFKSKVDTIAHSPWVLCVI